MAGLTPAGFDPKTLADILDSIQAQELAGISPSLNIQPNALIGVLNGIMAAEFDELWQLATAMYVGMNPDESAGDQLTGLALITGTARRDATFTRCIACVANVNAGFFAAAGTMFASVVGSPDVLFTNEIDVSNPSGVPTNEVSNFVATTSGPVQALASTLTVISVPLSGWNTITNPTDGVLGSDIESDPQLRIRRTAELSNAGSSTADAIRADVLEKLPKTVSCHVYFNDADATDVNGLPGHSIEVIARLPGAIAADDQALADLILDSKAAGIGTYGLSSKVSTDSQGNEETIKFTRPTDVPIYVVMTVLKDPDLFPPDGALQIKEALAGFADAFIGVGDTVYIRHLQAEAFTVPGVLDVTIFKIGTAPAPTGVINVPIGVRQIATVDTANIAVTVI